MSNTISERELTNSRLPVPVRGRSIEHHDAEDAHTAAKPRTLSVRSVLSGKVKSAITVESFTIGRSRAHVVFVPDCSGSRRGGEVTLGGKPGHVLQKEAIVGACLEFDRLAPGRAEISVVAFDVRSTVRLERRAAHEAAEIIQSTNIADGMFGGTDISAGLQAAADLVLGEESEIEREGQGDAASSKRSTNVAVLLSDGGHNPGREDPLPVAEAMKRRGTQLAAVWYPGPGGKETHDAHRRLMVEIASPELFFEARDVSDLPSILKHAAMTITQTVLR